VWIQTPVQHYLHTLGPDDGILSVSRWFRHENPQPLEMLRTAADSSLARFEQFVEESEVIIPTAGDALGAGDLERFGRLVDRSQELAVRALRNQVPETIELARLARELGAVAASAFGAGFGGSVWALVEERESAAFLERWRDAYLESFPRHAGSATFFVTRPGPPARHLI
jgi:galactokinase